MTGILQIISDAVGNKRVKERNKMYQERILKLEEDCEYCFKRKEIYKDSIEIIRAKVEMFNRQNSSGCECLLSTEILKTINQALPDDKTITPGLDG